jgi:multidrug transporter EmrE-like cation transporter
MLKPFILVLIAISFSVSGELCLKTGMNRIGILSFRNLFPTLGRIVTTPLILVGFSLFILGAVFWLSVLSRVNLSWAYPMLSIGYILILIFSALILREHVTAIRWIGALVICLGVVLVFRS